MCGLICCEVLAFVLMHLHRACVYVCVCMFVRVQMYIEADGIVVYYIVPCTLYCACVVLCALSLYVCEWFYMVHM